MTTLVTSITQSVASHRLVSAIAATLFVVALVVSVLAITAHPSAGSGAGSRPYDTVDCGAIPHNRSIPHGAC